MTDNFSFYKGKNVLVTGGLGFLGSTLALKLHELGARVTIFDGLLPNEGSNWFNIKSIRNDVSVIEANLIEREKIEEAVKEKDVIFHIAGHASHVDSMKEPFRDVETNILGQLTLLEACRKNNPTVKFIYCGTRAQYGKATTERIAEDHPMFPLDVYGVNKLAGEHYAFLYQNICGLKVTSLRCTNIYGPRHQMRHAKYGVQNYLLRLALDGQEITVYEPGTQARDYLYVDDAVRAFLYVGKDQRADGQAYNIGSGRGVAFIDFVRLMIRLTGNGTMRMIPWPKERAMIETGDAVLDCTKIKRELGWRAEIGAEEGLKRTIDFYRKYKEHYWV